MAELETTTASLVILLRQWKRSVGDTYCLVKTENLNKILLKVKSFHKNIQFTYEDESNNMLPFLDILVISKNNNIETTVYRKPTNNNIYLN